MGCAGLRPVARVPTVEGKPKPLAFLNQQGVRVTVWGMTPGPGPRLGVGVGEQQMVRDVFVP